ncbi:hypothetical protein BGZ60DRAFT_17409 [Tricladium varicosporioides]|nr:hypothetical protein BGZ60DRAFT_17409 [Hymenoscyphus varicosporioides]
MLRIPGLIYRNKFALPAPPPPDSFTGKSILITGATSGLGFETAVQYVLLGAGSVNITARSLAKGNIAKEAIEARTGTASKSIVKVHVLDMSTFAGVKQFADSVMKDAEKIDVVLLNAGVFNTKWKLGVEGYEETIQINVLSTVLLGLLLLPWVKRAGGGIAHLGFVSSGNHRGVPIEDWPKENVLHHFSKKENWPTNPNMYSLSKLLVQYCIREIAGLAEDKVVVNSICPGMVKSNLGRDYRTNVFAAAGIDVLMTLALKTTEGGSRTYTHAALTTPVENGQHFTHYQSQEDYNKAIEHNILSQEGQQMQVEVWREVLSILDEKVPGVKEITRIS